MEGAMEFDMDAPLAQSFNIKRKARQKEFQSQANKSSKTVHNAENASFPLATEPPTANTQPNIIVSEFNYSIENHLKDVDSIAKLCGYPEIPNADHDEITRLSNSVTFLREWRDFKYAPRVVRFSCHHSSKEKELMGEVTLPQFSAASVLKDLQNGNKAGIESSRDFVMNAGGAIWALDWSPRVDHNFENHIHSEFIAVAAHPPESSYHKIGAPLTGRGAIQIWCLLTVHEKDVPTQGNKKSRRNVKRKVSLKPNETAKIPKPKGRPKKIPINDSAEQTYSDSLYAQPLFVEYPKGSPILYAADRTENTCKHVSEKKNLETHKRLGKKEHANVVSLTAPKDGNKKAKAGKEVQLHNNGLPILGKCELRASTIANSTTSSNSRLDYVSHDTSSNSIPMDVALPRMMLCLAHNGKVAWDVKWKPISAHDPKSMNIMGYLAVLLGNGALEVWEIPFPHTMKLLYRVDEEYTDPRFIKLQPVFRGSLLKCGDRQSIPLTVEWSISSSNDMIVAGCHDGVVALWKFCITDSLTETRPLLSFSADTSPIRSLAWAPMLSDLESSNVIVTAGYKGFKFWDIRDPFCPLWEYTIQGATCGLVWLPNPRCVFGSTDDGYLWLLSLERSALDIPITGKSFPVTPRLGFHNFHCSSFAIWSVHTSRLTGMVAYCGEDGTAFCFKPSVKSTRDPSRHRLYHHLCGSLLEEEDSALAITMPVNNDSFSKRSPSLKRSEVARDPEKRTTKGLIDKSPECDKSTLAICNGNEPIKEHELGQSMSMQQIQSSTSKGAGKDDMDGGERRGEQEIEPLPPKNIAMHIVRWNENKGSEKWLCYGGAAGLLRCREVDSSVLQ